MNGAELANAAVVQDGVELNFEGDKCGRSYWIKRTCIKTWDSYFYDWREGGWLELRGYGGWHNRHDAIQACNKHATENRLIKFLPTRPKFKANWGGWGMGAAGGSSVSSQAASLASGAVSGLLGL